MQIGQSCPKNISEGKRSSGKTPGRQARLRALNRANAAEPAAQRNNRPVAGSGRLAGGGSLAGGSPPSGPLPKLTGSEGGSLTGSPTSVVPPEPPVEPGGGSLMGSVASAVTPEPPVELAAGSFELPLEPGVQPISKRTTAPTRTTDNLRAAFSDMTCPFSDLRFPHHAEPQQMMAQIRQVELHNEILAIAIPCHVATRPNREVMSYITV